MRYWLRFRRAAFRVWSRRAAAIFLVAFAYVLCTGPGVPLRTAPREAAAAERPPEVLPARGEERYVEVIMLVTAYTAGPESTGRKPGHPLYGVTASGVKVFPGVVAADPAIPFGTRVWVPGYGYGVVLDRGGAIRGLRLDVYIPDLEQAREWGVRRLPVRLYGVGPEVLKALEEARNP